MKTKYIWSVSCFLVLVFFELCYGLIKIIPTNTHWLMAARHDWGTHYLGWYFYRNEPWGFPLGRVDTYFYPLGTNVGITDSIPLMAIFFKIFSPLLPENFQYFGIWLFLCFLLTAFYTILLFKQFKINDYVSLIAVILITFNPVLVHRGLHPALCAHWLFIAGIYLYFNNPHEIKPYYTLRHQFIILLISALTNPYMCLIVLGFSFILAARLLFFDKIISIGWATVYILASMLGIFFTWFIVGLLSFSNTSSLGVTNAYGLYSLNLNALYNPAGFSAWLPQLPWVSWHQYEGFMYLGLGMIILAIFVFFVILFEFFKSKLKSPEDKPVVETKDNKTNLIPLLIYVILLSFFAFTHKISLNDKVLFEIPVPQLLIKFGDIFRASARFFWIVYYLIFIVVIYVVAKNKLTKNLAFILLLPVLFIQIYDQKRMLSMYNQKRESPKQYEPPLQNVIWNRLIDKSDALICYPPLITTYLQANDYQDLSFLAAGKHKPINTGYVPRQDNEAFRKYTETLNKQLEEGAISKNAIYITTPQYIQHFFLPLQENTLEVVLLDGYCVLFSKERKEKDLKQVFAQILKQNTGKINLDFLEKTFFQKENLKAGDKEGNITFGMERVSDKAKFINFSGWAFRNDKKDNNKDSIFIILQSEKTGEIYFAKTKNQLRKDVSAYFKKENLDSTGFYNTVFEDKLEKGKYKLGIYIKDKSNKAHYTFVQSVKIGYPDYYMPVGIKKLPKEAEINHGIDFFDDEKDFVKIAGWAAIKAQDSKGSEINLILKAGSGAYISPTDMVLRPDVSAYFKNQYNMDDCGFNALISKKALPKGKYQVGIYIKNPRANKELVFFTDKVINN